VDRRAQANIPKTIPEVVWSSKPRYPECGSKYRIPHTPRSNGHATFNFNLEVGEAGLVAIEDSSEEATGEVVEDNEAMVCEWSAACADMSPPSRLETFEAAACTPST
jgi:hypothetical protein